jgi:hypothetical protein
MRGYLFSLTPLHVGLSRLRPTPCVCSTSLTCGWGAVPKGAADAGSPDRPGGNVTEISLVQVAMAAKRLEVLRELVPAAKIIGLLTNPANPNVEIVVRGWCVRASFHSRVRQRPE